MILLWIIAFGVISFPFDYKEIGIYYLGDPSYGVRKGNISPYRGFCYHLKEFSDNPLRNDKELFNLFRPSLRTSIKRHSRVLKKSFRVLDVELFWSFPTRGCSLSLLHNSQSHNRS